MSRHHHDHDHASEPGEQRDAHAPVEETFTPRADLRVLEQALRELLIEKGVFSADQLRRQIEETDTRLPEMGAKVVAHAWANAEFRQRLLTDAKTTISEYCGIDLSATPDLIVVENTASHHHVICCTLCSCYPRAVLGVPPAWYKSREYRSRVVFEPRKVLAEFGTELPPNVAITVVDSNADMRYIVLPCRPEGTAHLNEEALAALVTRDSMIGVSLPLRP